MADPRRAIGREAPTPVSDPREDRTAASAPSPNQRRFALAVTAVLSDIVVLNLFVEFVDVIVIDSFVISIGTAILIRALIELALRAEHRIATHFRGRSGVGVTFARLAGTWVVLFLSKFVILEAVDVVFGDEVELGGVLWVIVLSLTLVVVERSALALYGRL